MSNPIKFSIQLRDRQGSLVNILNKYVRSLSWEYDRIGGCGRCNLSLAVPYDFFNQIGPDFDLQIWSENSDINILNASEDLFYIVQDRSTADKWAIKVLDGEIAIESTVLTAKTDPILPDASVNGRYWKVFVDNGMLGIESTTSAPLSNIILRDSTTHVRRSLVVSDGMFGQTLLADILTEADLVYRGYLESNNPILQENDSINLSLFGYVSQLKRVRVQQTYSSTELSLIIKDILDNYVLPDTNITYDEEDIETTNFSVDSLEFDTMADQALKTLADLAGTFEWGVDKDRKFFFKQQSDEIRHYLRVGKDLSIFDSLDDYSLITNRIYLKGGQVGGVTFEDQINNSESQTSYGLRSKVVSNSAIVTSAVAQQYGTSVLSNNARIQRRVAITVPKTSKFYEQTTPLGALSLLYALVPLAKFYNDTDAIYGQFKYGGIPSFQIDKLRYTLGDEGTKLDIQAGTPRPNIYLQIKRLQYEIDQLRGG